MAAPFEDTLSFGLEEVRKDLQLLLDKEVTLGAPAFEWAAEDGIGPDTPLDVEMVVEGEIPGRFRMRFGNALGIVMSGLLMMVNEKVITDRLGTGKLEEEDADAMGEVGNQVAGSLNTGLTAARPESSFHVRRGAVWLTGTPGPRMDGSPVLRMTQPIEIKGFPPQDIEFTFDAAAAELALGAEAPDLEAESPPAAAESAVASAPRRPPPRIERMRRESTLLVLYETRAEGWETAEVIQQVTGWPIVIQRLDGSARHRLLEGKVSIVVLDVGEHKERGLRACRRLVRLINGADIPVFLCAPSWRREEVQRAIRAGVSGILVKPLEPERIEGAIAPYESADEPTDVVT